MSALSFSLSLLVLWVCFPLSHTAHHMRCEKIFREWKKWGNNSDRKHQFFFSNFKFLYPIYATIVNVSFFIIIERFLIATKITFSSSSFVSWTPFPREVVHGGPNSTNIKKELSSPCTTAQHQTKKKKFSPWVQTWIFPLEKNRSESEKEMLSKSREWSSKTV